jgi:hypothetical protein
MQQAISSNLDLFFRTKSKVGENVEEVDYLTAINNTIETSTGTRVESFTLSSPTGDIIVTSSEIATLGVINF